MRRIELKQTESREGVMEKIEEPKGGGNENEPGSKDHTILMMTISLSEREFGLFFLYIH